MKLSATATTIHVSTSILNPSATSSIQFRVVLSPLNYSDTKRHAHSLTDIPPSKFTLHSKSSRQADKFLPETHNLMRFINISQAEDVMSRAKPKKRDKMSKIKNESDA